MIARQRPYPLHNWHEAKLEEKATIAGWKVTKRGWPDFICTHPEAGERIAVEVKPPHGKHRDGRLKSLKRDQADCMDWLEANGIRCFMSDGISLFRYDRAKHYVTTEQRKRRGKAAS